MSKLPNAHRATINRDKITGYLLNFDHSQGRGKAMFFSSFGFSADRRYDLRYAPLHQARTCEVIQILDNSFGRKYIIEGAFKTPDGRTPIVRAVWFIANGASNPVFVTAFPGKESQP
jgi:hypothetical protein